MLHDVQMWDGSTSSIRLFPAKFDAEVMPLIAIWPGWGMGARYYDPIARELASRGYPVVSGELHGQGTSTARATREHSFGYHQMASSDYPETIRTAKREFGLAQDHPTYLLCHSMGGQVASLFMARPEAKQLGVAGVMGVGAGSPYWPAFRGNTKNRLHYGTWLMWLTVKIFGYQPAGKLDLAGYGRQARAHFQEWHRFSRTNRLYDLLDQDMDYEAAKKKLTGRWLLTRFSNDEDCPVKSAENLADHMPAADIDIEEFPETLGHNRWARDPKIVSDRLESFIRGE